MEPRPRERWATFDCYGTLVDWNRGIGRELERLFGVERAGPLVRAYHEVEPQVQREDPTRAYRDVLAVSLARLAEREGLPLPAHEGDALARSLPEWPPFPEVRPALEDARARGWRLAILSNTDRDYLEASIGLIGVPFDHVVVASEIGSYKPAPAHWLVFAEQTGADPAGRAHVAASLFHDIASSTALGIPTIWINRLGEAPEPPADAELRSLDGLGAALDALVPQG